MKDQFGTSVAAPRKIVKIFSRNLAQSSVQNVNHNGPILWDPDQRTCNRYLDSSQKPEIPTRDELDWMWVHADGTEWQFR